MKIIASIAAALMLAACSAVSPALDNLTGTTKDQRCADYRGALAGAATALTLREVTG
jgi:hypothetical protein